MSIVNVRFRSEALGKQTGFNVIHPDQGEGPFPVLVQLHGFSDDSFSWITNSNLVRHVHDLPLIVVLPDGGTARYLNVRTHERFVQENYEDLIMRDIPAQLDRMFHVRPGPWAIGGLSMGGFGALRLGMKHPDRFASIWAHSAGLRQVDDAFLAMLDDPNDADVHHYASLLTKMDTYPVISFDCGIDDFLIDHNRELHQYLTEIGLPHTYQEHPGEHTWDYWDDRVQEALAQHARVLGIIQTT
jgi:S-formylglutathione hydrolase FrmB